MLDVKVGKGAFMKTEERARALADSARARRHARGQEGRRACSRDMDAPLGRAVGNANETREAIEVLHGAGPADLVECTLVLGAEMLVLGGKATRRRGRRRAKLRARDRERRRRCA